MTISYHHKTFRSLSNSGSGEVDGETRFHYRQEGKIVTATYSGGAIQYGQLIARMNDEGILDMRYQHVNRDGQLMTGQCISTPEVLANGKLRLHEQWTWTSGDGSSGISIVEEV
ncbi:MAG: n-acetylglutamate synthase [Cyclobacteriaceae bacterium]|jgi:hypothetical protein